MPRRRNGDWGRDASWNAGRVLGTRALVQAFEAGKIENIARMNRDYLKAALTYREETAPAGSA